MIIKVKHWSFFLEQMSTETFTNGRHNFKTLLALVNTLGYHIPSKRYVWYLSDGEHHSQIDCILVKKKKKRFRLGIRFARS